MSNLKLGIEVVGAHNLLPKDQHDSSSAFVELCFDGQKFRTTIKEKDLNPVWNESFYFNISDPSNLHHLSFEACIYNSVRAASSRSFLGKVCLSGNSFIPHSDAMVLHYPLKKRGTFSRVRGELVLKVYITDDVSVNSSTPLPADESLPAQNVHSVADIVPHNQQQPAQKKSSVSAVTTTHDRVTKYIADEVKAEELHPTKLLRMYSGSPSQPADFAVKETIPILGGGRVVGGPVICGDVTTSSYDLVARTYLFIRVVKARDLPAIDIDGSLDPYIVLKFGNYRGITKHFEQIRNPEWNEVFAFSRDRIQASMLEVVVKDKDLVKDGNVGFIKFDINEIPTRVPPESPLDPEWYRVDNKGYKIKGELMLAVWIGTQEDEAFSHAYCSDTIPIASTLIRSNVYHAPPMWYLRINVVEAQDLVPVEKNRFPVVHVKVVIGDQVMRTKSCEALTFNAVWNEDLVFVVAEPLAGHLILSVEDRLGPGNDEVLGRVIIPLSDIEKRADDWIVHSQWFNLEMPVIVDVNQLKKDKFSSCIHLRLCLEEQYHVLDDATHYSSDLFPTAKHLWRPPIGLLGLRILDARELHPMKTRDGRGTSDTFCVAKYGHKWVRTCTRIDNLSPKYNEQYTWEVFDPATVLTIGVFDSGQLGEKSGEDLQIGKIHIRLSTLETDRVYTLSYPLLVLHPTGVKKMGELHLAIRFTCTSFANMLYQYSKPLLPKMHYVRPFSVMQLGMLRQQAINIVAMQFGRAEPPLTREVVEYMSDVDSHLWSMRRSKTIFFRICSGLSGLFAAGKWFGDVCMWKNPVTTVLVHALYLMLACFPGLILSIVFLYMSLKGIYNYRYRPRHPPHMDLLLSHLEVVDLDELDEEFDTFPTSKNTDLVSMRYDRLRSVAGRFQTVGSDIATQVEHFHALFSWRDPRATAIFVFFCLVAALVLFVTPLQVVAALAGFYMMRHPRFRYRTPSVPINFFRRLSARTDSML